MTDENPPPTPPGTPEQERSWAPETGWPTVSPTPSWSEVEVLEETADEEGLDAWLDAQDDTGDAAEPEPVEPEPVDSEPAAEPADLEPEPEPEPFDLDLADADADAEPAAEAAEPTDPELLDVPAQAQAPHAGADDGAVEDLLKEQDVPEAAVAAVPGSRSSRLAVALMVVLVLVLSGLTALLAERSVSTRGGGGVEDARRDALQAARNAARLVFSYDYRQLDKDFAAGKAVSTGKFGEQYGTTTPKLVSVATTYKAVVVADVSDAAVISAAKDKVVVLVFVNQQSTSTLSAAPKITQSRLTMTLVDKGGRWLLSEVNAF